MQWYLQMHAWCRPSSWAIFITRCQTLQLSRCGSGFPDYFSCAIPLKYSNGKVHHLRAIESLAYNIGRLIYRQAVILPGGSLPSDSHNHTDIRGHLIKMSWYRMLGTLLWAVDALEEIKNVLKCLLKQIMETTLNKFGKWKEPRDDQIIRSDPERGLFFQFSPTGVEVNPLKAKGFKEATPHAIFLQHTMGMSYWWTKNGSWVLCCFLLNWLYPIHTEWIEC